MMSETSNVGLSLYPSDTQIAMDNVKKGFAALENTIRMNTPSGLRQTVALTHLETAAMFAVKSIFEP